MRTQFYLLLAVLFTLSATASAQYVELGLMGGFSVYSGDLSPAEQGGFFAEDLNAAGGLYLRYRPFQRVGLRVNGVFGRLSAERTVNVRVPGDLIVPVDRNFRSKLTELNAIVEVDLFYLGDPESNFTAPYLFGGIGILSFEPESAGPDGSFVKLQPLATEGQGIGGGTYDDSRYDLTETVFIVGGGIRFRFAERFVVGVEVGGRITGTDYLDDISDTRVNYLDVLSNPAGQGSLSARFSNPAVDPASVLEDSDFSYTRGGEHNDFYFVGGVTLGISIGGGGGKGDGCYKF